MVTLVDRAEFFNAMRVIERRHRSNESLLLAQPGKLARVPEDPLELIRRLRPQIENDEVILAPAFIVWTLVYRRWSTSWSFDCEIAVLGDLPKQYLVRPPTYFYRKAFLAFCEQVKIFVQ